jgi:hypothetical protein
MAVDNLETEYHLTPSGWVEGTERFFGDVTKRVDPPASRVLTIVGKIYQSSGYSPEERSRREEWRLPSISDAELADLERKFPCPFKLSFGPDDLADLLKEIRR